ncbi:hypothetical protein AAC387_Pa02g0759 [Persea americana]
MLPSSPTPHSQHIIQSGSNPCGICTDPVDEHLQANDSLAGPSLPHSDPSPASPELTTELPTPAPVAASHPMLTRAKAGIFKPRHPANLALSGSSGLLSALLTFTEPKGFKSAAKNPAWLTAKDEEVQALQTNQSVNTAPTPQTTLLIKRPHAYTPLERHASRFHWTTLSRPKLLSESGASPVHA